MTVAPARSFAQSASAILADRYRELIDRTSRRAPTSLERAELVALNAALEELQAKPANG